MNVKRTLRHMQRVVAFGEVMLRLSPPGYLRLLQTQVLERTFGGAELNVAVSLAQFGVEAAFVTKLPQNDIAQACINEIRGLGVDTRSVMRGGDRMGVYFVEKGAAQRSSTVLYDRAGSAIAEALPDEWDWDQILSGAGLLHLTGITPALSANAAQATKDAAIAARTRGVRTVCDLNYRSKLWTEEAAGKIMAEILPYIDYAVISPHDARMLFGIEGGNSSEVAVKLIERFGFTGVATTQRDSHSASRNAWSGMFYTEGEAYVSPHYEIDDIIDRVGGGDAFTAGLIYGLVTGLTPQETVDFAAAASCLKHSIPGDFNLISKAEVETLLSGDGSGRVRR